MKPLMNEGKIALRADVTPAFVLSLHEKYDTAIRHTAEELGRFFAKLDEVGLFDDALIVLTADHGEELFDHGGFAHRYTLHREILHVPLFVKLPGQHAAQTIAAPVGLTDLHATLLDWLDLEAADLDGASLAPLLAPGAAAAPVPEALRDRAFVAVATNRKRCVGRAIRQGDHALIELERSYDSDRPSTALYDLARDPQEMHDVGDAQPALRAALARSLELHARAAERAALPAVDVPLSARERAALEALGYTGSGRSDDD